LKGGRKRTKGGKKSGPRLSEFGVLAQARHHMKGVVELTGTPAPNGLIDMWGPIYILDGGERLGASRTAFLERWFNQNPYSYKITPKEHAEKEITKRVKDVMLGLRADDYLELPKTIHNLLKVRLPKEAMQEYRRFERTLVSELYDVEAVSEGVLTNKLLQFANGSMYHQVEDDKKKREVIPIHEAKLAALEGVLEEAAGQSVLLAYSFRFDLDRIRKRYPKAVVFDESPNAVKDWNAGRINLLLAHPASIGHGLNLQFGGHISVWYGLTWSLELWDQFNKRLPRPGQIHPLVYNHILVAEGTADEDVYRAMSDKGATQDAITDAIRVRLRIDQSTTS
jgi:SNF2 family DNA or RNA helicase